MKNGKFEIGDKVVPHDKTIGYRFTTSEWHIEKPDYLVIVDYIADGFECALNENLSGESYRTSDLTLYIEPVVQTPVADSPINRKVRQLGNPNRVGVITDIKQEEDQQPDVFVEWSSGRPSSWHIPPGLYLSDIEYIPDEPVAAESLVGCRVTHKKEYLDCTGTIIEDNSKEDNTVCVKWDNGKKRWYVMQDLTIADKPVADTLPEPPSEIHIPVAANDYHDLCKSTDETVVTDDIYLHENPNVKYETIENQPVMNKEFIPGYYWCIDTITNGQCQEPFISFCNVEPTQIHKIISERLTPPELPIEDGWYKVDVDNKVVGMYRPGEETINEGIITIVAYYTGGEYNIWQTIGNYGCDSFEHNPKMFTNLRKIEL